jgi:hypothetical protein
MSSPKVVFTFAYVYRNHTILKWNKPLVPEWPCIIEVSDISSSYSSTTTLDGSLKEIPLSIDGFT